MDLYQYCPECKRPQAYIEVKGTVVRDAEWEQVRLHAEQFGCLAILVVEKDSALIVKYFDGTSGEIRGPKSGGEEMLLYVLEKARDQHKCPADQGKRDIIVR